MMRKVLIYFVVLFVMLSCLPAGAENNDLISLTIGCFPPELCGRYEEFTPDKTSQNELLGLLEKVEFHDMTDKEGMWPDIPSPACEISLSYGGYTVFLRGEGWILKNEKDGPGTWIAQNTSVMECVLRLLAGKGYEPFDLKDVNEIVRAELCDGEYYTGQAHEPVIIEDDARLKVLENLISSAVLTDSSGCPFGYAKLILVNAQGREFTLYPATDSCSRFFTGGSFFNYDSARDGENHDTNQILFDLFGITAFDYYHASADNS